MSKATENTLGSLHGQLAMTMANRLKSGDATPTDLNAIRQFLKDNGITCDPDINQDIQNILEHIPTGEELDTMEIGMSAPFSQ